MSIFKSHVQAIKGTGLIKLVIIPLILAVVTYVAPMIFQLAANLVFPAPLTQVGSVPAMISMVLTLLVMPPILARVSKIGVDDLGFLKKGAIRQILLGAVAGTGFLALVFLILWMGGAIKVGLNPGRSLGAILIGLVFFIAQGTWEELIYRGWLMPHLEKAWNLPASIIVSSAIFVLGHALNPGMHPLPILNLFIASLVFSLAYVSTGSLWFVGFAHGLWNFSQGFLFGAEVSGNGIATSLLRSTSTSALISGGSFGFEGGLVTTCVGIALIVFMIVRGRKASAIDR